MLFLVVLLFTVACSDIDEGQGVDNPPEQKTEAAEETTPPSTMLETTGDSPPPEVTLGDDEGGTPEVTIRLEGDPGTTFSGLCSVGAGQEVLSGQVPKRFEFDLNGRQLSCRIEKRDDEKGDLKVVLIVGETTRSVQQTSTPDDAIKVNYEG